ncbi:hypothetical protein LTR05_000615 [Lithohypha guttulata]|uniref:Uncharacterized protein n=1 Tax=Lithohypha guttulata TaxID=1690604 RepID=A0AAN7T5I0_9EURO|nr:hypothetical protein LTR05_000615 [Lithohypha guttulata]
MAPADDYVDILILGAGWTSQFLVPHLRAEGLKYRLTTTSGKTNKLCEGKYDESIIIPFAFQPTPDSSTFAHVPHLTSDQEDAQYNQLPTAQTIIITFPLKGRGQAKKLVEKYKQSHTGAINTQWIQLGSTGVWKETNPFQIQDQDSPIEINDRAIAEEELRELGGSVLCLAGLWGDERVPWNWVKKIAPTKDKLREKKSLHLIHGDDVARACLAYHQKKFVGGERWIVTDQQVYDWWELIEAWSKPLEKINAEQSVKPEYAKWIAELKREQELKKLPRSHQQLGRVLNSSDFWKAVGIEPRHVLKRTASDIVSQL